MKNSYGILYIENPFQIVPDFRPKYLLNPTDLHYVNLPYVKEGKIVFLDNQIKIEGKKIEFASDFYSGCWWFSTTLILFLRERKKSS